MAYDNPEIRNLFCFDLLVGQVWHTHNGLGGTSARFRLITQDAAVLEFLSDFELIYTHVMEKGADAYNACMAAFILGVGPDVFEEEAWRVESLDSKDKVWLLLPPFIDFEEQSAYYKINRDYQPE